MKRIQFVIVCSINLLFIISVTFYNAKFLFASRCDHRNIVTKDLNDSLSDGHDNRISQTNPTKLNKKVLTTSTSESTTTKCPVSDKDQGERNDPPLAKSPAIISNTPNSTMYLTTLFSGRLGNHLFIYASLLGLARAQNRVPFISDRIGLGKDFQISFINPNISSNGWRVISIVGSHTKFVPTFFHLPEENLTLSGSFQSWKYFQHIQAEIRREFTFSVPLQEKVQTILAAHRKKFLNHAVVGIHARRGDFLEPKNIKLGYGVPNRSYFEKAMSTMKTLLGKKNVTFLVASDDLTWCQENLNDSSVSILPQGEPSFHLALLASCDHVIISGGTFGWWTAWLANGITIYFKNFILPNSKLTGGYDKDDYFLPGWIGLDN
nr:galactoside 2-alpha-L-fucosyltransferase 1-like [Biomphalaria glabrata]